MANTLIVVSKVTGRKDEYEVQLPDGEVVAGLSAAEIAELKALKLDATGSVSAATTSLAGKVELALNTETYPITDQTRAVTPYGLGAALARLYAISFTGKNGAGACTATGTLVSDVVLSVCGISTVGAVDSSFEGIITVQDQIQQAASGDLSTVTYMALVYRP